MKLAVQDRVECSGAQMAEVAQQAERITAETGRTTRVVGWYHSHPHITVLPSHIDVNTQVRTVSMVSQNDCWQLFPNMVFLHMVLAMRLATTLHMCMKH